MTRVPGNITALQIAKANGIDPKMFRRKLREKKIRWHQHGAQWQALKGSPQHADMEHVMKELMSSLGAVPEP